MFRFLFPLVALSLFLFLPSFFLPEKRGERLYMAHCAKCHHPKRIGKTAPPLLPEFLKRRTKEQLKRIIQKGLPASQMPAFSKLTSQEIQEIIAFLRTPSPSIRWGEKEILTSYEKALTSSQFYSLWDRKNVTAVVERGKQKIWIVEGKKILDTFSFPNVHGGIKFSPDLNALYVPARDGWVGMYSLKEKRYVGRLRVGIYLRNIAVDRRGKYLIAALILPLQLVVLSAKTLAPVRLVPLKGKVSAIYPLTEQDKIIGTFRSLPLGFFLHTKTLEIQYFPLPLALEDFFLDPFDRYLIGSNRRGRKLVVYDLLRKRIVFEHPLDAMPHLFSATYWYWKGKFYFATPHLKKPWISIWQMYQWRFVKKIPVGGRGFFVRTHPRTPYLFVDNQSPNLFVIRKEDWSLRKIPLTTQGVVLHTEFSADGSLAYVSIFHRQGKILLLDTGTLEKLEEWEASYPVGKYNLRNKSRKWQKALLGEGVFLEKCWGCHHPTERAFGPSFRWISRHRTPSQILAQLADPKAAAKHLGGLGVMPRIPLTQEEIRALLAFIEECK